MRRQVLGLFCAMAGCVEPDMVLCSDGLACPAGSRCDEVHRTCVQPDQLTVCQDLSEGADCAAGPVSGGCFDGVCLPRGCGNRVVESGEMCDDGNQISLDGCRGDCTSTEVCGNGFVDPGEPCDDGDLISRDGCDSRCQIEEAAWSFAPIAPDALDSHRAAYDEARGLLVAVTGSRTAWTWDGTRWSTESTAPGTPYALFYDPDRGEIDLIASDELITEPEPRLPVQIHAWRGGAWVQVSHGEGPSVYAGSISATYDAARHRVMVIETGFQLTPTVWTLDSSGAWMPLPPHPDVPGESVMAYDPVTEQVLVETGSEEWVYDGAAWSSSPTDWGGVSIAFDPTRGRLVMVDNVSRATYERIGTEWALTDTPRSCTDGRWFYSPFYYNAAAGALDVFSIDVAEICRWDGAWSSVAPAYPSRLVGATYDPVGREFLFLHVAHPDDPASPLEMWSLTDGAWRRTGHPAGPTGRRETLTVYSPGRRATILYGGYTPYHCGLTFEDPPCELLTDAWSFDGSSWTPIAAPAVREPFVSSRAATYDPDHRRIILATTSEMWSLADGDDAWVELDTPPLSVDLHGLAWDARNDRLVAAMVSPTGVVPQLFEQGEDEWAPIALTPSVFNAPDARLRLLNDERGGGVLAIDVIHGFIWERVGSTWVELPPAPMSVMAGWTAYDPVDGRMLFVGETPGQGQFATFLKRRSATPLESCRAGEDVDGDGLSGCDDPECYWLCTGCLPDATCGR